MSAAMSNVLPLPSARLPEPLVPPDADLRAYPSMLLDVSRLRDSALAGHADPEVFRVGVLSWCASWHQVPAGSLPSDDNHLIRLLGWAKGLKAWRHFRNNGGLYGWFMCSDGRLYHSTVAQKVLCALAAQRLQHDRTRSARAAKAGHLAQENRNENAQIIEISRSGDSVTGVVTECVDTAVTSSNRKEEKRREEKKESPPSPRRRGVDTGREYSIDFLMFWDEYPRREAKPVAWRAWQSALKRGQTTDSVMACLYAIKPTWAGRPLDKIKLPATWLNSDPWQDGKSDFDPQDTPAPNGAGPSDLFGAR